MGEAQQTLLTALQQYQDRASKQRRGKFGSHHTADEMHYSLASLEVQAAGLAMAMLSVGMVAVWTGTSWQCNSESQCQRILFLDEPHTTL